MRVHNRLYTLRGSDSDESTDGAALVYILFLLQFRAVPVSDEIRLGSGSLGGVADIAAPFLRVPSLFIYDLKLLCSNFLYYRVPHGWDNAHRQEVPILHFRPPLIMMHVQVNGK